MDTKIEDTNVSMGVIAYLTIIGLIIAFVDNQNKKNDFTSFHLRQSLGIAFTGLAIGIVGWIPLIGWLVSIIGFFLLLFMWISGLLNAMNKKEKSVPVLGKRFSEWFKNVA